MMPKIVQQKMWGVLSGTQVVQSAGVLSLPLLFKTKKEAKPYRQYYGDRLVRVTIVEELQNPGSRNS